MSVKEKDIHTDDVFCLKILALELWLRSGCVTGKVVSGTKSVRASKLPWLSLNTYMDVSNHFQPTCRSLGWLNKQSNILLKGRLRNLPLRPAK